RERLAVEVPKPLAPGGELRLARLAQARQQRRVLAQGVGQRRAAATAGAREGSERLLFGISASEVKHRDARSLARADALGGAILVEQQIPEALDHVRRGVERFDPRPAL